MARKNSTKRHLDELLGSIKTASSEAEVEGKKAASGEDVLMLAFKFAGPVTTAFEKAGLDIEDFGDWVRLTIFLSAAAYRKAGRRPTWSRETYERLLNDVSEIKAAHPDDDEAACCKRLLKRNEGTYNRVRKIPTLRRQLQNAKRWKKIKEKVIALAKEGKGPMDILKAERKRRKRPSDNAQITF